MADKPRDLEKRIRLYADAAAAREQRLAVLAEVTLDAYDAINDIEEDLARLLTAYERIAAACADLSVAEYRLAYHEFALAKYHGLFVGYPYPRYAPDDEICDRLQARYHRLARKVSASRPLQVRAHAADVEEDLRGALSPYVDAITDSDEPLTPERLSDLISKLWRSTI